MIFILLACTPKTKQTSQPTPQETSLVFRSDHVDVVHGVEVSDPYQWMENKEDEKRSRWVAERNEAFFAYVDKLSITETLKNRFLSLWRYDDRRAPEPCLNNPDRQIIWTKNKEDEKFHILLKEGDSEKVLLNPNEWELTQSLSGFYPSPDCALFAYGIANAGDENPVISVMKDDGTRLPDTVQGWKQRSVSWLHDNSGFYYSSWPTKEEGLDPNYYHRARFHVLGTQGDQDTVILKDDDTKEFFHGVGVSEDGRYLVQGRYSFNTSKIWIKDRESDADFVEMMPEMDANYEVYVAGQQLFILTDWDAPRYRIMTTTIDKPQREHWTEFVPQGEDIIRSMHAISGHVFVNFQHNASTLIKQYSPDGSFVRDASLPGVGSASISGLWKGGDIFISYASFAHPKTTYTYDMDSGNLKKYKDSPIDIDTSNMETKQVFYPSKDGTMVSMSLMYPKDRDGEIPFLLTGYGGFNVSLLPRFSTLYAVWLEAGGGLAIPNLRGGGEYGQEWHKAGMREHKQNVFDDFIAAAEYLVAEKYTKSSSLAISGGSNGGLLVSAVSVQRPDLFRAVLCSVPLTDMVRYHRFGLANIWSEEYGNADDPMMFPFLHAYSPYHNMKEGVDYPSMLIVGAANDARTDPIHALKFAAQARFYDRDHGNETPIFLNVRTDAGHQGGVGLETQAKQYAQSYSYLMDQVGLTIQQEQ